MDTRRNKMNDIIDWGERRVRTDLRYVFRGGSWLVTGQMVGIAVGLLVAMGYAHFLTKETYGTYKYILSILGILSLFALPGMENGAQKGIAQHKDGVFWDTFKYRVLGGGFSGIFCGVIGVYYYFNGNHVLGGIFFLCAPFLIMMEPLAHYNGLLSGRKLFKQSTIYGVVLQVATSLILFVTVYLSNNIFVLMLVYVSAAVMLRGVIFTHVIRHNPLNNIHDKSSTAFGAHLSVLGVLGTISSRLDSILLFHFLGPVPLAIYSFAQALVSNVQSSFKLVTGALAFPKMAAQDKEVIKKTLMRKVFISHTITIPISILVILIIPTLYRFLFPQYLESIPYAQVLTGLLAFAPLRFISTAISALAPTKMLYTSSLTGSILYSLFLLALVPFYGIWGIIIAMITQQSMSNMLNVYLFRRM